MATKPKALAEPKNTPGTIGRSTLEAYAGIAIAILQVVFPMTFAWKIMLTCALAFIAFDIPWRHERIIHLPKRDRLPIALFGVVLISSMSFWPLRADYIREYEFNPDPDIIYFTNFGPFADVIPKKSLEEIMRAPYDSDNYYVRGWPGAYMTARAAPLRNLRGKYQLIGMLFHHQRDIDFKDETVGGESERYDIPDADLEMRIVWSTTYPPQILMGMKPTYYALLSIPKDDKQKSFSSIRDATAHGGILIQVQTGPP